MGTTVKMPDGKGGFIEVDATEIPGGKVNPEKHAKAMEQSWYDEACTLTDAILKFAQLRARELNLTKDQFAFAGQLALINMRETFPGKNPKDVDSEGFDRLGELAWDYWDDANKSKKP